MNTTAVKTIEAAVSKTSLEAAAVLCGMEGTTPDFRSWARNTEEPEGAYTIGDISRAYLKFKLQELGAS